MKIDKHYARGQFVNCISQNGPSSKHEAAFITVWWFAIGEDWFDPWNGTKAGKRLTRFYFDKLMK